MRASRPVKTLHIAYRVTDLAVSLDFNFALGYRERGRVDMGEGASLTMLKFPGEEVVTLELVHRPAAGPVQQAADRRPQELGRQRRPSSSDGGQSPGSSASRRT